MRGDRRQQIIRPFVQARERQGQHEKGKKGHQIEVHRREGRGSAKQGQPPAPPALEPRIENATEEQFFSYWRHQNGSGAQNHPLAPRIGSAQRLNRPLFLWLIFLETGDEGAEAVRAPFE